MTTKKSEIIERIELERRQIVNIGTINWRQMELLVDGIRPLIHDKYNRTKELDSDSEIYQMILRDIEDLEALEKQIWSIITERWNQEKKLSGLNH